MALAQIEDSSTYATRCKVTVMPKSNETKRVSNIENPLWIEKKQIGKEDNGRKGGKQDNEGKTTKHTKGLEME